MENSELSSCEAFPLLKLSNGDNVLVAVRTLPAGTELAIEGKPSVLNGDIGLGHKVAARLIKPGEKIIKCHVSIGSATQKIAPGEHVHLHNMKSDYLPTYVRSDSANPLNQG